MTHILMLTRGTEGDVRPFVQIGKALTARGHLVTLVTHCVFEQPVRQAGLGFASFDTPGEYEQCLVELQQLKSAVDFYQFFQKNDLPQFERTCALLEEQSVPGDTTLVVCANAYFAARTVSEKLNLPIATFIMGPGLIAVNTPLRPKNLLATPFSTSTLQLAIVALNRCRAALGLPPVGDLLEWWVKDNLLIAPWPDWFAQLNPEWPLKIIQTGFLPGGDPGEPLSPEVEALLAEGPAPVLLTGGTGVFVDENYYTACLAACQRLGRRVILVARRQAGLPASLPGEVSLFPTLPFASLMPHMAAVIHHGGIGTTTQALVAGVPQLILAQGIDRPDNAMRVERLGVGKFLPPRRWEADAVTAALTKLLDQPAVQARCRELAHRIHQHDGLGAVSDVIESLPRPG